MLSEAWHRRLLLLLLAVVLCVPGHGAKKDHYEVLGVAKDASDAEIKRTHKSLAKKWHPDINKDKGEKAKEMFRQIQEAYEILGDPEKKKRYDNARLFYSDESGEPWEGAEELFDFDPPGDPLEDVQELNKVLYHSEPTIIHVYADQRHFFGSWMNEVAKDIKMWHINVFTVDEAVIQRLNVKKWPSLTISDGFGRFQHFSPSGHKMPNFHELVRSFVAQVVPYDDLIEGLITEDEVDAFLRLHPKGSSKPRVLLFTQAQEQMLLFYLAAAQLKDEFHFAQLPAQKWNVERFKLQGVPSFIVLDPATRHGATQKPQILGETRTPKLVEQLAESSNRFVPELTNTSFQQRCQGEWDPPCRWIALFLVPSAALGIQDGYARKALRIFRDACNKGGSQLPCFWLRHDNAAGGVAWKKALEPLFETDGVLSESDSQGLWIMAVEKPGADEDDSPRAVAFPKSLVDRDWSQQDLTKWIKSFQAKGVPYKSSEEKPAAILENVPPVPLEIYELTGPLDFVGKLNKKIAKWKLKRKWREFSKWCKDNGMQWLLVPFFMIVWPRLTKRMNGGTQDSDSSQKGEEPSSQGDQPAAHKYKLGTACVIQGLKSNTVYNGQSVKILKLVPLEKGSSTVKYEVRIKVDGEVKVLAISEDNLHSA